jgi:hypothetical protein
MAEWSEDHVAAIGPLKHELWNFGRLWLNWRPGGALRRKGRPLVRKVGEWSMVRRHLQGCSPFRWRLWTNGLAPVSKYWKYRSHAGVYVPSKPSSLSSTESWLKPIPLLVGLGEKLGTDLRMGQPACYGLCREPFSSGAVWSIQICRWLVKGSYMWTTWDTYGLGPYTGWA